MDMITHHNLVVGGPDRQEIPCLITTERRALAGFVDMRTFDGPANVLWHVRAARNCRNWDTTAGTGELANTGPGPNATFDEPSDAYVIAEIRFIRPLTESALRNWYRGTNVV